MSWTQRKGSLVDYAKNPGADLGRVKYDEWKLEGSGKGIPKSKYDGQTASNQINGSKGKAIPK